MGGHRSAWVAFWVETRASQPSMRRLRKLACAAALLTMKVRARRSLVKIVR